MRPAAALALVAAAIAAALLARHTASVAGLAAALLVVCAAVSGRRTLPYVIGTAVSAAALFLLTPFVETIGSHPLWSGPIVPVLGQVDVTREELVRALFEASRLAAVGLAFALYALALDHDRLLASARVARRSSLAVVLATRLVPTLQRDAEALVDSLRARGVAVRGARAHARLVSPLLAGSLERALNVAEAMEARGYGRPARTRVPPPPWRAADAIALAAAVMLVVGGGLWL